ncbi:histone H2B-like [Xyrauchen texanus]|uniref:histone H2B-like n=1 Tax=Xyrauchen texanus TaxID=154827 RepID=UPI002241A703|nr:histone H2B-like [Xyrauchen texanus]
MRWNAKLDLSISQRPEGIERTGYSLIIMLEPGKSTPNERSKKAIMKITSKGGSARGPGRRGMGIMNSFINDIFKRIGGEASHLTQYKKHSTITSREIQTAVSEGTNAITKYTSSK